MITISLPKRAVAVGLAFAVAILLTGAVSVIPTASADDTTDHTIEQLQEQITSLQDQLAALSGGDGGGGECYAFTRDLYNGVGSGDDVTALQDYLTGTGHFTFSGGSTGYFGPITQTAAGAWQADNGVAPTAGYWGPISRAAYNSVCTPGDGDDDAGFLRLHGAAMAVDGAADHRHRRPDLRAALHGHAVRLRLLQPPARRLLRRLARRQALRRHRLLRCRLVAVGRSRRPRRPHPPPDRREKRAPPGPGRLRQRRRAVSPPSSRSWLS